MCMARAAAMIITTTMGMTTTAMTMLRTTIRRMITPATITRVTTTPPMDTNILMIDAARLQRPSQDQSRDSAGSALPLLIWLSPAFPVGAFAYSHGLEAAVEAGDIRDAATLQAWLDEIYERDGPRAAFQCVADLIEFHVPKLARRELVGVEDGPMELVVSWQDRG